MFKKDIDHLKKAVKDPKISDNQRRIYKSILHGVKQVNRGKARITKSIIDFLQDKGIYSVDQLKRTWSAKNDGSNDADLKNKINDLTDELNIRPTQDDFDNLKKRLDDNNNVIVQLKQENDSLKQQDSSNNHDNDDDNSNKWTSAFHQ